MQTYSDTVQLNNKSDRLIDVTIVHVEEHDLEFESAGFVSSLYQVTCVLISSSTYLHVNKNLPTSERSCDE